LLSIWIGVNAHIYITHILSGFCYVKGTVEHSVNHLLILFSLHTS